MYLCDACGARLVVAGKCRPLVEIWGANQIPWRRIDCANCGSYENCMNHPEASLEMFDSKEI